MNQNHMKLTDQEWFDLIRDCRSSGLTVRDWCSRHDLTVKAFYYHTHQLRKKGYEIPDKTMSSVPSQKQEIVCLNIAGSFSDDWTVPRGSAKEAASGAALSIDFHGIMIGISNHAAQDTITNTLRALHSLC